MSTLHLGNALGSVSMPGQYHIDNRELTAQKKHEVHPTYATRDASGRA